VRNDLLLSLAALSLLTATGCKNEQETQIEQAQDRTAALTNQGRSRLADGKYGEAVRAFSEVTTLQPTDSSAWLLLAEAHKRQGNGAAALMALKQAESLLGKSDPAVRRERAELYKKLGQNKDAIAVLAELRDANQLTDPETLDLAHLQARVGDIDGAWKSLEQVQKRKPDDPEAKAIEAEVLLLKGDEVLGARLLDRLAQDYPMQASARIARAHYFFANGLANEALQDLEQIQGDSLQNPEYVALKARILNELKKYDEALLILKPLAEANPKDADLACLLAETLLLLDKKEEAEALIDQALAARSDFPRALYVRGRSREATNLKAAIEDYEEAIRIDPRFSQAASRLWPIYEQQGQKGQAIAVLEKLLVMQEASPEEKLFLVALYCSVNDNPTRAKKLVEDVAKKRDKNDPQIKELRTCVKNIKTGTKKKNDFGIIIMRRGRVSR
jgi:tetratricopeptide (TPR) repeat protein